MCALVRRQVASAFLSKAAKDGSLRQLSFIEFSKLTKQVWRICHHAPPQQRDPYRGALPRRARVLRPHADRLRAQHHRDFRGAGRGFRRVHALLRCDQVCAVPVCMRTVKSRPVVCNPTAQVARAAPHQWLSLPHAPACVSPEGCRPPTRLPPPLHSAAALAPVSYLPRAQFSDDIPTDGILGGLLNTPGAEVRRVA